MVIVMMINWHWKSHIKSNILMGIGMVIFYHVFT